MGIELTVDSLVLDKSEVLDLVVELCSSPVIRDDQNSDLAEVCDEGEPSKGLKLVNSCCSMTFFVVQEVINTEIVHTKVFKCSLVWNNIY